LMWTRAAAEKSFMLLLYCCCCIMWYYYCNSPTLWCSMTPPPPTSSLLDKQAPLKHSRTCSLVESRWRVFWRFFPSLPPKNVDSFELPSTASKETYLSQ